MKKLLLFTLILFGEAFAAESAIYKVTLLEIERDTVLEQGTVITGLDNQMTRN